MGKMVHRHPMYCHRRRYWRIEKYQHYCESYDAALKVIKDNHIEKVKTYNLTLDEELK